MDLVFAYGAGLLTLINPCVLPVLPLALAASLQAGRWGPLALALGMGLSFVALGLAVATAGRALGFGEEEVSRAAAIGMVGFGLVMLLPAAGRGFAFATAGIAARADLRMGTAPAPGFGRQVAGGALLSAVWSPCIGPTLGAAISLASVGEGLGQAGLVMAAFALGVGTVILALGHGARAALARHRGLMAALATGARPIMGGAFVAVGLMVLFRLNLMAEAWLVENLPTWLVDLSVSL